MRALSAEELNCVSGGYEFGGPSKPVDTVTVPGKRPTPKGGNNWTIILCDGECGDVLNKVLEVVEDFWDWARGPEIKDANGDGKPGDTLNCPPGTAPAIGVIIKDPKTGVPTGNTYTCAPIKK